MRKILFGVLGLLFWLATQWIALGIAAGGHGWIEPLWLSMFLVVLYPIAFIRAFCVTSGPVGFDQHLLVGAGALDVLMLGSLFLHQEVLRQAWSMVENRFVLILWIGLWSGWQMLALATLIRKRRFSGGSET